ncbi:hypothetical protein COCNU_06G000230 [Cocos nucifera]|uniref:Uncharacterized protein n=1 Tax=Cocos nucifera TaxID=13894 RepID=A0A8K0N282_COCNU|nr:hypothetical protein COCNU_06G000230 [Cocos nucifera]
MGTIEGPKRESSSSNQRSTGGEGMREVEAIGVKAKAWRGVHIRDDGHGMGSGKERVPGRKSLPHIEMMNADQVAAAASLRVEVMAAGRHAGVHATACMLFDAPDGPMIPRTVSAPAGRWPIT